MKSLKAARLFAFLIFLSLFHCLLSASDEDLTTLINKSQPVVALIACSSEIHNALQTIVTNIQGRDDVPTDLQVLVIVGSEKCKRYRLSDGNHIIYFRNHSPLLMQGDLDENILAEFVMTHRDGPYVKHLTDETFEHDTQAATGATTGDWLVLFHDAEKCGGLELNLETAAAQLFRTMSVAEVELTSNPELKKRFRLEKCINLLFFQKGSYYVYQDAVWPTDVDIVAFVQSKFSLQQPTPVPAEAGALDDLMAEVKNQLHVWAVPLGILCLVLVVIIIAVQNMQPKKKEKTS